MAVNIVTLTLYLIYYFVSQFICKRRRFRGNNNNIYLRYVELLDKYFGSVCELDIIFNFEKAYFVLDELLIGGEVQETSKKSVLKAIAAQVIVFKLC